MSIGVRNTKNLTYSEKNVNDVDYVVVEHSGAKFVFTEENGVLHPETLETDAVRQRLPLVSDIHSAVVNELVERGHTINGRDKTVGGQ